MESNLCKLTGLIGPIASFLINKVDAQQAYCFDQQCVGCANPAPRLCPPENIFTYFDCCVEGCCQFVKWPNLIFLVIVIIALLAGCVCCCFFLVSEANQRKQNNNPNQADNSSRRRKKSARRHMQDNQIATIEQNVGRAPATPIPPPRYGDRRSTVV